MGWIIFIIYVIGWHIGIYLLFKKAGFKDPWKGLIPFYNTWIITQHCGIKKFWFWLQFIPIAGQFITIWMTIIFVMHFGKFSLIDHILTVLVPFIYLPYLSTSNDARWIGHEGVERYKKSTAREWVDALVFAVVAATIIRTFVFEAYTIPTGSMEKTLLINDFLFVNKMSYGARLPVTPLSFPFVHNTMPLSTTTTSYLKWIQLPYKRLAGFGDVKRNDVVVFNFPAGDTIINLPGYGSLKTYYDVLRYEFNGDREALKDHYPIIVHPMDKTDNYIKRCVGVPGDELSIKNGILYVNGKPGYHPPGLEKEYLVKTNGKTLSEEFLKNELKIDLETDDSGNLFDPEQNIVQLNEPGSYIINCTEAGYENLKKVAGISVEPFIDSNVGPLFPQDPQNFPWSVDNFGPIRVPKKGDVIQLSQKNIALYRRLITTYENNALEEQGGRFFINGKETTTYEIKLNYYWMMGDNRHRSQDSRYWGFVPETHIVGKATLIFFSWKKGPRFSRIFSRIK